MSTADDGPTGGNLDVRWHAGCPSPRADREPPIQVHAYAEHTVILRQNKSVHYEAPFMFLLFGARQAMLIDTGATAAAAYFPLRRTVDALIGQWLARHPRPGYRLIVTHTHAHGDHIAADDQFTGRPDTAVVAPGLAAVRAFHGFTDWPATPRPLDLGGRLLDVIPGPGHERSAVVFYDRATGLLLTGDTLYPGRLYIADLPAYRATVDRLITFSSDHPIGHVLGCHIEMTRTPGRDYPIGTTHQPDEPPLELTAAHLHALRAALDRTGDRPGIHVFPDFVLHTAQP
jgi:glyoxylase-like metal-dependent hydrolase (beta-lactamase superfamily II)